MSIINRLRNGWDDPAIKHEAADMLEFFFEQMQYHSLHMDGTAAYRFHGGWPLSSVRATTRRRQFLSAYD